MWANDKHSQAPIDTDVPIYKLWMCVVTGSGVFTIGKGLILLVIRAMIGEHIGITWAAGYQAV